MFWQFLAMIQEIGWEDVLDISLASILLWFGIDALRRTRMQAAGLVVLVFCTLFLIARQLEMKLTVWILQGMAALFVLIVIIVFQSEIRILLEKGPRRFLGRRYTVLSDGAVEVLCEALGVLSTARRGALVVLAGNDSLGWLITDGVPLDGRLSLPLLLSVFDPNSPGHDGALIVEDSRVTRFGVHLPLSRDNDQLKGRGTRHAAALGLAEKSDALVLVVSEETGSVSSAHTGKLLPLGNKQEIKRMISGFLEEHGPSRPDQQLTPVRIFGKRSLDGVLAVILALALWVFLVPGSEVDTIAYRVPLNVENVPVDYALKEVVPSEVSVTLSGPRRKLFLYDPRRMTIPVDATLTRFGRQTFSLNATSILLPPDLEVAEIQPSQVKVFVESK